MWVASAMIQTLPTHGRRGGGGAKAGRRDGALPPPGVDYGGLDTNGSFGRSPFFDVPLRLVPCGGGWRCAELKEDNHWELQTRGGEADFCDVDVLSPEQLSAPLFAERYRNRKPFVLRRAPGQQGKEPWLHEWAEEAFSRLGLLARFGDTTVSAGTSLEIVARAGRGYHEYEVAKYVATFMNASRDSRWAGEPLAVFVRGVLRSDVLRPGVPGLFAVAEGAPANLKPKQTFDDIWLYGPPLSGTAWHYHPEAWTGLAYGRKRWMLYPPTMNPPTGASGSTHNCANAVPSLPITTWLSQVYPHLAARKSQMPQECIQRAGDLFYVPEGWAHGVVNLDDSVAVSFQNKSYATNHHLQGLLAAAEGLPAGSEALVAVRRAALLDRGGDGLYHITRPLAPPYSLHTVLLKLESYNDTGPPRRAPRPGRRRACRPALLSGRGYERPTREGRAARGGGGGVRRSAGYRPTAGLRPPWPRAG
jgi:hypothetical protein